MGENSYKRHFEEKEIPATLTGDTESPTHVEIMGESSYKSTVSQTGRKVHSEFLRNKWRIAKAICLLTSLLIMVIWIIIYTTLSYHGKI